MGAEQSTPFQHHGEDLTPTSRNTRHPSHSSKSSAMQQNIHRIHSKPTPLMNFIMQEEWQKVLVMCHTIEKKHIKASSTPRTISATGTTQNIPNKKLKQLLTPQKVRLYGIDRKILPIHLVCALRPPTQVMEALLKMDERGIAVRTPVRNKKVLPKRGPRLSLNMNMGKKNNHNSSIHMNSHGTMPMMTNKDNNGGSYPFAPTSATSSTSVSNSNYNWKRKKKKKSLGGFVRSKKTIMRGTSVGSSNASSSAGSGFGYGHIMAMNLTFPPAFDDEHDHDDDGHDHNGRPAPVRVSPPRDIDDENDEGECGEQETMDLDEANVMRVDIDDEEDGGIEVIKSPPPIHHKHNDWFVSPFEPTEEGSSKGAALNVNAPSTLDKENVHANIHYALQITPSGGVKQISPHSHGRGPSGALGLGMGPQSFHSQSDHDGSHHGLGHSNNHPVNSSSHAHCTSQHLSALADEFLPIHIACLYRASPSVIALLLDAYPEGTEQKNKWGMLPLHIVCANIHLDPPKIRVARESDADAGMYTTQQYLNHLYQETMRELNEDETTSTNANEMGLNASCSMDADGNTPFQVQSSNLNISMNISMKNNSNAESSASGFPSQRRNRSGVQKWDIGAIVEMLIARFPQSVHVPSDNLEFYTPLEYASKNLSQGDGSSRETVMDILKKAQSAIGPTSFTERENSGFMAMGLGNTGVMPLHMQMNMGSTMNMSSGDGQSMSSSLSDSKASSIEVNTISKAFPISSSPALYKSISSRKWDECLDQIVKSPEEASYWVVGKDYPRLPLHLACTNRAPQNVIRTLIEAYSEGCAAKDGSGSHPLHLACEHNLELEIVSIILEQYPDAATQKDEIGRLPLHIACATGASLPVIKLLIDTYPAGCSMKDYNGHTALTYVDYNCVGDADSREDVACLFEPYEDIHIANSEFCHGDTTTVKA